MLKDAYGASEKSRWDCQKELVKQITQITTQILPDNEGVVLRFINQDVNNCSNLTPTEINETLERIPCKSNNSHTKIARSLKSKILEPLVYNKLEAEGLEKPLLISVITDGIPNQEHESEFAKAIFECGNKLQHAGYPRESACLCPTSLSQLSHLRLCHLLIISICRCEVHGSPDRRLRRFDEVFADHTQ